MSEKAARLFADEGSWSVSLRIRHPSIDPAEITQALGLAADHCWACGEPRRSEAGLPLGGRRHDSYWTACLPAAPLAPQQTAQTDPKLARAMLAGATANLTGIMGQELQIQLQLMAQLRRNRSFLERLIAENGEVVFVIEIESRPGASFKLDPALMRQIGALGARLEFEFV